MAEKVLLSLIILVILEDNVKRSAVRGKTQKGIVRGHEKGLQNNLNVELRLEDTKSYNGTT